MNNLQKLTFFEIHYCFLFSSNFIACVTLNVMSSLKINSKPVDFNYSSHYGMNSISLKSVIAKIPPFLKWLVTCMINLISI